MHVLEIVVVAPKVPRPVVAPRAIIMREQLFGTKIADTRAPTSTRTMLVTADGSIPVNQLQDIIMEALKGLAQVSSSSLSIYAKPYTQRIDMIRMPTNY